MTTGEGTPSFCDGVTTRHGERCGRVARDAMFGEGRKSPMFLEEARDRQEMNKGSV